MIKAKHRNWAQFIFDHYIRNLLKKNFSHYYLAGPFPKIKPDFSYLVTPNHISWWDGFFLYPLLKNWLNKKAHLMMLEEQLSKHWYFRHIGAFSINPGHPKSAKESLNYAGHILTDPDNFLIFYPQGKIEAFFTTEPDIHKGGLRMIGKSQNNQSRIFIISFCINYYNEMKPEIIMLPGPFLEPDIAVHNFPLYKENFNENLEALKTAVQSREFVADIFPDFKI